MNKKDLEAIISFAKANGMMKWAFEDVLNEYLTTKEVAEDIEGTAMDDYEFYLSTGGQFHSPEEFETWLKEAEEYSTEQQLYEEYLDDAAESYAEYERYCYEQMTLSPEYEECLAKQMLGEMPIENGNKLSVVNELYLMGCHLSENFKTLYPKAWEIFRYYRDML